MCDHHLLADFPLVITVPLLWGDQDAFGHVNNLACLRWAETARVEYLQRAGLWTALPPTGIGPILAAVRCDYKEQLNYPDTVHVGTRVINIGNSSFRMEHRVVSHTLDTLAAELESIMVMLDYSVKKAVPVPAEARETIGRLEGKSFTAGAPVATR